MRRQLLKSTTAADTGTIALLALLFLAAAFRLNVALNLPTLILPAAALDDALFMRLAINLASGHWLGAFNEFTLVKGPGYPLFLAGTALSGLPLSATHGLFQIVAMGVTAWAVYRLTHSRTIAALTFLALAFHPGGMLPHLQRVFRDQIYWGQALIVFSLVSVLCYAAPRQRAAAIAFSLSSGTLLAWAWLTREEGVWLLPGLAVLAGGAVLIHRNHRDELRALARNGAVATVACVATIAAFMATNLIAYGSFVGVDVKEHNFKAALNALQSVEVGPVTPYLPVPAAVRSEVAKVSPTFKPLNDALVAGGPLDWWSKPGCKIYKQTCGDIAGGWFMWALRNAAALNGFYKSPKTAAQGFKKIANEVAAACTDGRLKCRSRWLTYMPAVTHDQWAALPAALQAVATQVAFLGSYDANRVQLSPVGAAPEQFERYWAFLNYPHISALGRNGLRTTVQGWYRDSASTQWPSFAVKAAGGEAVAYTLKRLPSPDLQKYFAEQRLSWNRFDISYSCPNICSITALAFKRPDLELKIDRDSNFLASSGTATIYVDKVIHDWQATSGFNAAEKLAGHVRSGLVRIYQVAIPLLLAAGLLALIAAYDGAIATRKVPAVLLAATAAWVLVATRIVLLALIDVSSFPATSFSYSAPAAYLAVVAAILSIAAVLVQLPQAPRSRSQAAGGIR